MASASQFRTNLTRLAKSGMSLSPIVILWSSRGTWWVHKMKHDLVTQVEFVLLALRMVRIPEVVARHKG